MLLGDRQLHAQDTLRLPLGGNAFSSVKTTRGNTINSNGITRWRNADESFTVYFRTSKKGTFNLTFDEFKLQGEAELQIGVNGVKRTLVLNEGTKSASVGSFTKDSGYVAINIVGVKKQGEFFPSIASLKVSGSILGGETNIVKGNSSDMYFGRRGPSTHLGYHQPKNVNAEWFYNEVTVPKGEDILGTYFMANGFGEGYFGMQVNSPTERRVLFSVWSPFTTDNPKEIPEDHKIKLIKKGENVKGGEFGGEGSGGQSYMTFNWKAGTTYKFLMHIKPVADNFTEYTAYFYAPETKKWQLVASFQRPQTQTYAKRLHSFLECFNPAMGDVTRTGTYGNQWIADTNGTWTELTRATFTCDVTGNKGYRKDYQGGIYENGNFYLKIDGFFNDFTNYGQLLERKPTGRRPEVDLAKLP